MKFTQIFAATALALTFAATASAQTSDAVDKITDCGKLSTRTAQADCTHTHMQIKAIYLANVSTQNEANEILVAVRNVFDPSTKLFLLGDKNAIVVATYPEEIARIETLIHELDKPRKTYRLTFTLTDSDGGKRLSSQHYTLNAVAGQDTYLKQGTKIPVITGNFSAADSKTGAGVQTQVTYLDVGMNIDVTASPGAHGAVLKTKVEQSSVDPATAANQDPIIRQSVISGVSAATFDKPLQLGAFDIPNSTHKLDIEVLVEELP
jgi:type II secretory pathway component GspD/PulD (secretin)